MKSKTTRIKEIDILYSIGAILAVFGHSHPSDWSVFNGSFFYHCIVFIYTFHMPIFFLIAGILLTNSKSIESKPFTIYIKEKALKLLTPYFVLTLLTMFPKAYLEYRNSEFLNFDFIIKTFLSPRNNTWGHFWFLPVLFICYILFGFLRKTLFKTSITSMFYILAVCCILFFVVLLYPPFESAWCGLNDIFDFAFYVPLGMILAHIYNTKKPSTPHRFLLVIFSLLSFTLSVIIYIFFYNSVFARFAISLLMIFCLLGLANLLSDKCENFFNFLSKNIFTIYIYSWPFQSFSLIILEKYNSPWQFSAPIMFVVGIISPLIVTTIYKYFKKLNCRFFDLVLGIR